MLYFLGDATPLPQGPHPAFLEPAPPSWVSLPRRVAAELLELFLQEWDGRLLFATDKEHVLAEELCNVLRTMTLELLQEKFPYKPLTPEVLAAFRSLKLGEVYSLLGDLIKEKVIGRKTVLFKDLLVPEDSSWWGRFPTNLPPAHLLEVVCEEIKLMTPQTLRGIEQLNPPTSEQLAKLRKLSPGQKGALLTIFKKKIDTTRQWSAEEMRELWRQLAEEGKDMLELFEESDDFAKMDHCGKTWFRLQKIIQYWLMNCQNEENQVMMVDTLQRELEKFEPPITPQRLGKTTLLEALQDPRTTSVCRVVKESRRKGHPGHRVLPPAETSAAERPTNPSAWRVEVGGSGAASSSGQP